MRIMKIIIVLLLNSKLLLFSHANEIGMYVDLVNSYEKPSAVVAYLCWNIYDRAAFSRRLWDSKLPHSIKFVSEPTELSEREGKDCIIMVDLSCPGIEKFLTMANDTNMFNIPYRWLILAHKTRGNNKDWEIPSQLEALRVPHNSEVIVARENVKGHYVMYLIYKIIKKNIWLIENYGVWTSSGIKRSEIIMENTVVRRRNLHGEPLTVSFLINEPHSEPLSTDYDYKIPICEVCPTRWGYQQILPLFDYMNASRTNFFSDDWGYFVNGSWSGVVGDMLRGTADLAGTPLFMSKSRMDHVTYIMNPIMTKVVFVFREPPLSYQNNLFLLPFNTAVWYLCAAFVLLMMTVISINVQWEAKKSEIIGKGSLNDTLEAKLTISDVAMLIIGAITQQGTSVLLRGLTNRLLVHTMFLAFLFLFTAYSASIVVLLQSSSKQIRTLSDLLNSNLELGVQNTSYNRYYFATATDPVRKAIYETKVAPKGKKPNFFSVEDGVRKFQKGPFAFNMDVGIGYRNVEKFFFEHEKCGLQEIAYLPTSKPWLTCSKTSPYAELFKIGLFRTREHGMSSRANNIVYSKKPVCSGQGGSFASVSIVDVQPPLIMLLYGTLLACATLTGEVLLHRLKKKGVFVTETDGAAPFGDNDFNFSVVGTS